MNVLAKIKFGSHLYGTSVDGSDVDYRAVYLPPIENCLLMRVKDAWEDKTEEDTSFFSLQHFLRMALEGQSVAIELLAAPMEHWKTASPIWDNLHIQRRRFYTKSMHSFLGYAKTMAGKYSVRLDRLKETEEIMAVLDAAWGGQKLGDLWDRLPESVNARKAENERNNGKDKRCYRICGRELQATVTVETARAVVASIRDSYGQRVRNAKEGKIEWKSLAHAFRAALQCREIVETRDLSFPLKDAGWLRDLRLGKFDFLADGLDKRLDDLIAEVQAKIDASDLPDKPDDAFADTIVLLAYGFRS